MPASLLSQADTMPTLDTPILGTATVNDTLLQCPATIAVFDAFGVDACCGGAATLAEAATAAELPLDDLLHAITMTRLKHHAAAVA